MSAMPLKTSNDKRVPKLRLISSRPKRKVSAKDEPRLPIVGDGLGNLDMPSSFDCCGPNPTAR